MAFSPIVVTGKFEDVQGNPQKGLVRFRLTAPMIDSTDNLIVPATDHIAALNATGQISIVLLATDDTTTLPVGLGYVVTEEIWGAAAHQYTVAIPHTAPGATIDLADLAPPTGVTMTGHAVGDIITEFPIEYYRGGGDDDDTVLANLLTLLTEDAELSYASSAGGTIVFKGGKEYTLNSSHKVPSHVNIRGGGMTDTTITIGTNGAGFVFMDPEEAATAQISTHQFGGASGHLTINGNGKTGCPWVIGKGSGRSIEDLQVTGSGGDGVQFYGTQNCRATNLRTNSNAGYGIRIDYGAAGLTFIGGQSTDNLGGNIGLTGQDGYQHSPPIVPETTEESQIVFLGMISEGNTVGAPANYVGAGKNVLFINCSLSAGAGTVDVSILKVVTENVNLGSPTVTCLSCTFTGSRYTGTAPDNVKVRAIEADAGCIVTLLGRTVLSGIYSAFYLQDSASLQNLGIFGGLDACGTYAPATIATTVPGDGAHNEVQTITLTGTPIGSVFTIMWRNQVTANIAAAANAAAVQAALEALPKIGAGNVAVTGGPLPALTTITFQGTLALANQQQITALTPQRFETKGGVSLEDQFYTTWNYAHVVERYLTNDRAFMAKLNSQDYPAWQVEGNGLMRFGSGLTNPDTIFYRQGANKLRTDGKMMATNGLGAGNSAAATVLGSVVKKLEIFSDTGTSLGFIPIYDAIT